MQEKARNESSRQGKGRMGMRGRARQERGSRASQVKDWVYKAKQVTSRSNDRSQTKLPGQTGLPGINLLWASSLLHLKHWGSMLYSQWKETVILVQDLMLKILIPPPKCSTSKDCSQMKLPGQMALAGLGSPGLPLIYT